MFELHYWKCPDHNISMAEIGTFINSSLSNADLANDHRTLSVKTQHNLRLLLNTALQAASTHQLELTQEI